MIPTADEILVRKGLRLVDFDVRRQQNVQRETSVERFWTHFGSDPVAHAQIWEDLQTRENPDAHVSGKASADLLDQEIHFLKCHPKEEQRSGTIEMCKTTAQNWGWCFTCKVQALKEEKASLHEFAANHPKMIANTFCLLASSVPPDCLDRALDTWPSIAG